MRLCAKAGGPAVKVSDELFFVLERSKELSEKSGGAFDVTVGPFTRLWRRSSRHTLRCRSVKNSGEMRPAAHSAYQTTSAVQTAADGLAVTPLQVALAWVRDRPGVAAPVIGARNAQQLTAALSVEALSLPDEICRALDDVSAPVHRYPDHDWSTL